MAARPRELPRSRAAAHDVADAELKRLDAAGFRGVRFNFMGHLGTADADRGGAGPVARASRPSAGTCRSTATRSLLTDLAPALRRSPVPVVIDHIGRVDAALGLQQPAFPALLA